jgi:hypothetical protein
MGSIKTVKPGTETKIIFANTLKPNLLKKGTATKKEKTINLLCPASIFSAKK